MKLKKQGHATIAKGGMCANDTADLAIVLHDAGSLPTVREGRMKMLVYEFCKWAVAVIVSLMIGSLIMTWLVESGILWTGLFVVFIIWAVLGSLGTLGSIFSSRKKY